MDVDDSSSVRIDSVSVLKSTNAKILSQSVMRPSGVGRLYSAPWPIDKTFGAQWRAAVPAKGAVLARKSTADLVTEVEAVDKQHRVVVPSVTIRYTSHGHHYIVHSTYQLVLSTNNCDDMLG
jgi:hypothetical protein